MLLRKTHESGCWSARGAVRSHRRSQQYLILTVPAILPFTWNAVGCFPPAPKPLAANAENMAVPVMLGPSQVQDRPPGTGEQVKAKIANKSRGGHLLCMAPTQESWEAVGTNTLEVEILRDVPSCTDCTITVRRVPVGSYTVVYPVVLPVYCFSHSGQWSIVDGVAVEKPQQRPSTSSSND